MIMFWATILMLVSLVLVATVILAFLFLLPSRQKKIREIIADLEKLKEIGQINEYALDENIRFFKAAKHLHSYILWGIFHRPKMAPKDLLEIADLPLPRWERELYDDLTIVERRKFPGLTTPLRDLLVGELTKGDKKVVLDLGCGSMEAERQVLLRLRATSHQARPIFIGVDSAPQAWDSIRKVFEVFKGKVHVSRINNISQIDHEPSLPSVYFYCGDALKAAKLFEGKYDLVFSSRFRHHLSSEDKKVLDKIHFETPHAIEYDDYGSALSWLPPLLTAWNRPILLNGAVFSHIRQLSKKEVLKTRRNSKNITTKLFNPPGTYAKIFKNDISWWGKDA